MGAVLLAAAAAAAVAANKAVVEGARAKEMAVVATRLAAEEVVEVGVVV